MDANPKNFLEALKGGFLIHEINNVFFNYFYIVHFLNSLIIEPMTNSNLSNFPADNTLEPTETMLSLDFKPKVGVSLNNLDTTDKPVEYIAGMFPKGKLSALVGESGKGKSWVLVGAALTITDSKEFLPTENYEIKDTGKVLIIDTEGRIKTYAQRIRELGGNLEKYITPDPKRILGFNLKDDIKKIEECIEIDQPELVIIDSFAGFSSVDENTDKVMPCVRWFVELALKYDVAIVFTQLTNKSELKDGRITTKSVRGFSGIHQFPEIIWAIDTPDCSKDQLKRIYQIKNNIEQKDQVDYLFTLDNSKINFTSETLVTQKEKIDKRREIYNEHKGQKPDQEIAKIIQNIEPETKLNTLLQWVIRQKCN